MHLPPYLRPCCLALACLAGIPTLTYGGFVIEFREGDGYTGTVDTYLDEGVNVSRASERDVFVDRGADELQGLLRFEGIFGSGTGRIALGSEILSATLTLKTRNPGSIDAALHRMLRHWDDTDNWDDWHNGIQADGIEAAAARDALAGSLFGTVSIDVTKSLQAWSAGASNYGWVFLHHGTSFDGWGFSSSEDDLSLRPHLSVEYQPVPEPSSILLFAGVASLGFVSRQRPCRQFSTR